MSGRPARVGLMIPSSNTMMEVDFARELPPGAALHTARMFMEDTTPAGESRMLDEFALPAARDLGTARPDVVVFGCTSAGALRGNNYDTELCERISELTGAPTVSTIGAVRAAIEASGAASIGVITPYVDEQLGTDQPEVQHRHQALAAGQDLRLVPAVGQQPDRLVVTVGGDVVEGRGNHPCPA